MRQLEGAMRQYSATRSIVVKTKLALRFDGA